MTSREDHGWHDDRPCPPWCESEDHHLTERLGRRMDDFWHKGPVTEIVSEDTDHNWHPIHFEVRLCQHVQVDERGYYTHPLEVTVGGTGLSPANARKLAAVLEDLAVLADDEPLPEAD
jgi:hypothetical protein